MQLYKAYFRVMKFNTIEHCNEVSSLAYNSKLMEEVCAHLFESPHRVAFVGEYANTQDKKEHMFFEIFKDIKNSKAIELAQYDKTKFNVAVNHSKAQYVILKPAITSDFHPLGLLCAIGSGKGEGDYRGINDDLIGSWACDIISIHSSDWVKSRNELYELLEVDFNEF